MDDNGGMVSVADAAGQLGRSTEQVRRYLREGQLTGRRIGGQWFIDEAALAAFGAALRDEHGFLAKVVPANERDPLAGVIAAGGGGGSNMAQGKDAYRRAFWWRR